jgi:hypothetical protein
MTVSESGRSLARKLIWISICGLLIAGAALGLLAAFNATYDGGIVLTHQIWHTHSWLSIMGWCVPLMLALVCWLLPLLKSAQPFNGPSTSFCLAILVIGALLLGAYPLLARLDRSSLIVLPPAWALYSAMAFIYTARVWRVSARTLSPSACDVGVQSGAAWLLAAMLIKFIASLGAVSTMRHDYLASSEVAVMSMVLLGFLVNSGLALVATIATEFLRTPHPRPTILSGFATYNAALAIWIAGAMWCLPYPSSWGRILLSASAFVLFFATLDLLGRLRLFEVFYAKVTTARQRLVRLSVSTAVLCLLLAAVVVVVMSVWIAGTMGKAPASLGHLLLHLVGVSFPLYFSLALFTPVLGTTSLDGLRGALAYLAYTCVLLWTISLIALTPSMIINERLMWYERALAGSVAGLGVICFALWLLSAFRTPRRK